MLPQDKSIDVLRATLLFFVVGICMSFKLWMSTRTFPLVPVGENSLALNAPLDLIAIVGLIGLMFWSSIRYHKGLIMLILVVLLFFALQDQMRLQPWSYHYFLFLIPFCFEEKKWDFPYFQLIIIGIYFWGGIHKVNPNFIENEFPAMIGSFPGMDISTYKWFNYIIPVLEIGLAIGLLFKRTQKGTVILAMLFHVSILMWLIFTKSSNSIIIPWNVAMITFLYLCFYRLAYRSPLLLFRKGRGQYIMVVIVCAMFMLPILNYWGKWDHYLSYNLYSGRNQIYYIAVEANELEKLPYTFDELFLEIPGLSGGQVIDVNKWSLQELNVPIPPEKRVFRSISNEFCGLGIPNDKIMFLEFEQPIEKGIFNGYTCDEIK